MEPDHYAQFEFPVTNKSEQTGDGREEGGAYVFICV